jgi:hypothetical protein
MSSATCAECSLDVSGPVGGCVVGALSSSRGSHVSVQRMKDRGVNGYVQVARSQLREKDDACSLW